MSENDNREFLQDQLELIREQRQVYLELELKLEEMKKIAELAARDNVSEMEREQYQVQIKEYKTEVDELYKKVRQDIH